MTRPWCGSDGSIYWNACLFETAKCHVPTLRHREMEGADDVCAEVQSTHENKPQITQPKVLLRRQPKNAKMNSTHTQSDDSNTTERRSCECTEEIAFSPVCASDGNTYLNMCEVQNINCIRDTNTPPLKVVYHGMCWYLSKSFCQSLNDNFESVCGSPLQIHCGSNHVEYQNRCQFLLAKCKTPTLYLIEPEGRRCPVSVSVSDSTNFCARMTPEKCPNDYQPVYGSNGVVYLNKCLYALERCTNPSLTATESRPVSHNTQACQQESCPLHYHPVCGSDGLTYTNLCEFMNEKCNTPKLIQVTPIGQECDVADPVCATHTHECKPTHTPICASNGVTYPNHCSFKKAVCANPTLTQAEPAGVACKHRQRVSLSRCTSEYSPICGSDGQTYTNRCFFNSAKRDSPSIEIAAYHACENTPTRTTPLRRKLSSSCKTKCPKKYRPICGSNGVTYANICIFQIAQCENPSLTQLGSKGQTCEDVSDDDFHASQASKGWSQDNLSNNSVRKEKEAAKKDTTEMCFKSCPRIYRPICGSDGVTYPNRCVFEIAVCENDTLEQAGEEGAACADINKNKNKNKAAVIAPLANTRTSCTKPCPRDYNPVCGSNGVTFSNKCLFEIGQCEDKKLTQIGDDGMTCEDVEVKTQEAQNVNTCEKPCANNYFPVCGSDGKTYSNKCRFEIAQCENRTLKQKGDYGMTCQDVKARKSQNVRQCAKVCPRNYVPVCGSDGFTYSNRCLFEIGQCEDKTLEQIGGDGMTCEDVRTQVQNVNTCEKPCAANYLPVCGANGVTYSNKCRFEIAQCENISLEQKGDDGMTCQDVKAQESQNVKDCAKACLRNYVPVCGSDGVTYSNKCQFEIGQCEDNTLTQKGDDGMTCEDVEAQESQDESPCPDGPSDMCPSLYAPICASDGVTYTNECEFNNAICINASLKPAGPVGKTCEDLENEKKTSCMKPCPRIYAPVCGSNGVTYSNICEFEIAQCEDSSLSHAAVGKTCEELTATDNVSCTKPCVLNYVPVCGSDGVTYSNKCHFEVGQCEDKTLTQKGDDGMTCEDVKAQEAQNVADCAKACAGNYIPVCGSNGVTYSNKCQFEIGQCEDKTLKQKGDDGMTCQDVEAQESQKVNECEKPCAANYSPVCGANGVTYSNKCRFEIAQCEDNTLTQKGDDGMTCQDVEAQESQIVEGCAKPCSANYSPVCGSNGVTFSNKCWFEIAQCEDKTLTQKGDDGMTCEDVEAPEAQNVNECEKSCAAIYLPVCGSDGVTYSNECMFEIAQCKNNSLKQIGDVGSTCKNVEVLDVDEQNSANSKSCMKACGRDYVPVCGSDDVTYSNECLFEIAKCENDSLNRVGEIGQSCQDVMLSSINTRKQSCLKPCPRNYAPVCGSDGATYSNECEFEIGQCEDASLTKVATGTCDGLSANSSATERNTGSSCEQMCLTVYTPVCGSDGVTYSNECFFEIAQCEDSSLRQIGETGQPCEDI